MFRSKQQQDPPDHRALAQQVEAAARSAVPLFANDWKFEPDGSGHFVLLHVGWPPDVARCRLVLLLMRHSFFTLGFYDHFTGRAFERELMAYDPAVMISDAVKELGDIVDQNNVILEISYPCRGHGDARRQKFLAPPGLEPRRGRVVERLFWNRREVW